MFEESENTKEMVGGANLRARSPSRERHQSSRASLWADKMELYDSRYSDEEDVAEHVVEVSERTRLLLSDSCTQSLTNESRKHTWNWYNLPKQEP